MPKSSAKEWDRTAQLTSWTRLACIIPPDLLAAVAREADADQREALLETMQLNQKLPCHPRGDRREHASHPPEPAWHAWAPGLLTGPSTTSSTRTPPPPAPS